MFKKNALAAFGLALLLATGSTLADPPEAPLVKPAETSCTPKAEICGDGIDQNCDGSDALCPGSDADWDGYPSSIDCDDTTRKVYPGISVSCTASCGQGTKTCGNNGSFSACSCTPLCEASGSGKCYYISKLSGSDSNPGTFNAPWKTYLNIVKYLGGAPKPSGWVELKPGDVVYFMNGIYDESYRDDGLNNALRLQDLNGTQNNPIAIKAYPGALPVIAPSKKGYGIHLAFSEYVIIEGLEITKAWQSGFFMETSSNVELRNMWVHDVDGEDNENVAGIYLVGPETIEIHHSLIHDNYDRKNSDTGGKKTENSRNIVLFKGKNAFLHHNVIFQTPPTSADKTGACVTYKHSSLNSSSVFKFHDNILWNCFFNSVGSGTYNTHIHHNLILDSDPILMVDHGGDTHIIDAVIENNTFINSSAMQYDPTTDWGPLGKLTFRKNVISDKQSYHQEKAVITVHTYGSNSLYNSVVGGGLLEVTQNCYYNSSHPLKFCLFCENDGAGNQGGFYNFSAWQSAGFDGGSQSTNPNLDSHYRAQKAACQSYGWNG